jgi:hypothetical protein
MRPANSSEAVGFPDMGEAISETIHNLFNRPFDLAVGRPTYGSCPTSANR